MSYVAVPTSELDAAGADTRVMSCARSDRDHLYEPLASEELSYLSDVDESLVYTDEHVPRKRTCLDFVESSWFQNLAGLIILTNIVTMILETDDPAKKDTFLYLDQTIMFFYVFELCTRACFFGWNLLCGPMKVVVWNYLDLVVVIAGVFDQWLLPLLPGLGHAPGMRKLLQTLRLLRVFRVLKIIRIFLETDLRWTEEPKFQSFIGGVIAFNALLMGLETDVVWDGWFYIEQVLLTIYVFELSVRLKRYGIFFLSCFNPDIIWNVLDFVIVASSTLDTWLVPLFFLLQRSLIGDAGKNGKKKKGMDVGQIMMLMRMMRLMRILRLVKLIKSVRPLFVLVTGVLAALQGVMWVLVLTVTVLYAMGIVATRVIGHGMLFPPGDIPEDIVRPFLTVSDSMFTLFRQMSGAASDEEATAIDQLMKALPCVKFAFVFFMISSSWTLLSILTAVVSENMISTTSQQEEDLRISGAEEERTSQLHQLKELFQIIDVSGDGTVSEGELDNFLSDKNNALNTAKQCRVPVRDIKEVLHALHMNKHEVGMDEFVDCLVDMGRTATEKSILKIEARLTSLQTSVQALSVAMAPSIYHGSHDVGRSNHLTKTDLRPTTDLQPDLQKGLIDGVANAVLEQLRMHEWKTDMALGGLRDAMHALLKAHTDGLATKLEMSLTSLEHRSTEAVGSLREAVHASSEAANSRSSWYQLHAKQQKVLEASLGTLEKRSSEVELLWKDWCTTSAEKHKMLEQQGTAIGVLLKKLETTPCVSENWDYGRAPRRALTPPRSHSER